ncbi:hypothetical protein ATE84_2623 [Aquimarina sp. MAR_2010_214]|uniref:hypothetical protein n=1 Tax=Aquimarina sp. MAR_2010_214 TaxID=1250026 RepID=UPI000C703BE5|nr:hypothetical protein [Aquimarina sp. MAR_2010_214]PKV50564.1 hypothetical protein ATE84_2623 [Aquimarina sp. MAR_2010_214]
MKHLIFTLSLLAFVSCKDNKQERTKTEVVDQSVDTEKEHHNEETSNLYENTWINNIKLNNGNKWQANTETNEGILKMQNSIKTQTTSTLEDYYKLADQLNNDKNYVIKNCTMKGASHDNLHVWLLPLMEKIEALSEIKTITGASKLKHSIEENINAYSEYFQ